MLNTNIPSDVIDFLEQLAGADYQTIRGLYVVVKAQELVKRHVSPDSQSHIVRSRIKAATDEVAKAERRGHT